MRGLRSRLLWAFVLGWIVGPVQAGVEAPIVGRVDVHADFDLRDPRLVENLVSLRPGEPFTAAEVRRTLRNLHASGRIAEAEVWTRREAGDLVVSVAVWGAVFVESIELRGDLEFRKRDLREVVEQAEGQPLVEARILRSVFALQSFYEERGYHQPRVRVDVSQPAGSHRASVAFDVVPGPRQRIQAIELEGADRLERSDLIDELTYEVGDPYLESQVREGVDRLSEWLQRQGYLTSEVKLGEPDPEAGGAVVVYRIDLGPLYEFEIEGWERKPLERHELFPRTGFTGEDDFVLRQMESRVRSFLQEKGHYRARVDATPESVETADDGRPEATIRTRVDIEAGPEYRVTSVEFEGNESFSDDRLREFMTTSPRSVLQLGSGRLVDDRLEDDLEEVRSFYALSGWLEAEVGPAEVAEPAELAGPAEGSDGPRELAIRVPVREGDRTRVVDLTVRGAEAIAAATLLAGLPLESGGPYHPQRLEEALNRIRSRYEARGFDGALVEAALSWSDDRRLVDVSIDVQEGVAQTLERVIVRGNQKLGPRTIVGVSGLTPGEPLSRERLVRAQKNLYRLGIFSRVTVGLVPVGDDPSRRDVIIRATEGDARRVSYGVGWDSEEGLRGLLGYTHRNLWGRAYLFQVDLRGAQSTRDFRMLLSRPFWRRGRVPGSQKLYLTSLDEERESFSVDQSGVELELAWNHPRARYGLLFDFRTSELTLADDVILDDADLPDGQEGRRFLDIDITSITPSWSWDARDDPIDPRRGFLLATELEYAVPIDGLSSESFVKGFGQAIYYRPLGDLGVAAANLRLGMIEPQSSQPVSIAERFYAGGSTTHRAYDRDELGIPGETLDGNFNPVGGRGLLLLNLDWRFPISGPFGGTLFADYGNVWPDWRDIEVDKGKTGVGIGARYASPIGPLRFDVAWKLEREPNESSYEIFFSFGNAF